MDSVLIKSATIIDPSSPFNGKKADILIENGKISAIGKNLKGHKATGIVSPGLHVSPGWFDLRANFRDPGYEYKEDMISGTNAAAAGGFTGVACMPSTLPPLHSKAGIEYVKSRSAGSAVDVHPVGAITVKLEGKELTEMFDLHSAGAVAFSDDKNPVTDSGVLCRAMLYSRTLKVPLMLHCEDKSLSNNGDMNEGEVNVMLGLRGIPSLSEEVVAARNIRLAGYTQTSVHLSAVSSGNSVIMIADAKKAGIKVTADMAAHQVALDETELQSFNTNLKVNPPFRSKNDINALKQGLADGTIDVICSDHSPEDEENKMKEFDGAAFGIIGLETAFAVCNTYLADVLTLEEIIRKIAINPRVILNLPVPAIKEGETANLTLFDPNIHWTFTESHIRSKSKNTPFIGKKFTGRPLGIYNNGKAVMNTKQ